MPNLLDRILVVDVESTCWEDNPPEGQASEIIEIGISLIDVKHSKRLQGADGVFVQPSESTVSEFCTNLTTITQADVDGGISFVEACRSLREDYLSDQRIWASWGDYDRIQFQRQCKRQRVKYPFGRTHINIKTLFALQFQLEREVSVTRALKILDWQFDGTLHRANADAWNIAGIFEGLLWNSWVDWNED